GCDKESQECFAVAITAAHELLLSLMPVVCGNELVEDVLNVECELLVGREPLRPVFWFLRAPFANRRTIAVPRADDVADAIFMTVDRELVFDGKQAAFASNFGQLHFTMRS